MLFPRSLSRRRFFATSLLGGLATATAGQLSAADAAPSSAASRVALTSGNDRANLTFRGLKVFGEQIARAIGSRRIIIKPNNVATNIQLAATHVDCLEGILEFLKSIGKLDNTILAESAADGPTLTGFDNYRYTPLATKYGVKLVDLDQQPVDVVRVVDERDMQPHAVRMSRLLLDPQSYLISAARMKTHDQVVATLSLKNIIFGAPIKDLGFTFRAGKPGTRSDKPIAHGGGIHGLNYNLFVLAHACTRTWRSSMVSRAWKDMVPPGAPRWSTGYASSVRTGWRPIGSPWN